MGFDHDYELEKQAHPENFLPDYDLCMYDEHEKATDNCFECMGGLCDICGYIYKGHKYCNACYDKLIKDKNALDNI